MYKFTVVIAASFIPSHPSINVIKETINSLKYISEDQNFPIILAHDFSNNAKYIEYVDNLVNYISNDNRIIFKMRDTHGHLVGNIKNIIDLINTKYILMMQHDLPFIREFEIAKIIEDLELYPQVKHLRFNKRHNLKKAWDSTSDIFGDQLIGKNYSYTRTPAWSDQNHLCLTSYYKDIVLKESKDGTFMENTLYKKPSTENGHKKYGTYLFGEYNASPTIKHTDGGRNK